MRLEQLSPVFTQYIPKKANMVEGELYISKEFEIAVHLCACGCKGICATPISVDSSKQGHWKFTESGGLVSLTPSIGNWAGENPYHAHYFITNNKIVWA
jgi:Family of unknown function (DUF6527)